MCQHLGNKKEELKELKGFLLDSRKDKGLEHHMDLCTGESTTDEKIHPNTFFLGNHSHHTPFHNQNSWHHFPKLDMNKFYGFDPSGWVNQMDHYVSLSMELLMTYINLKWGSYTWIQNIDNDITNLMEPKLIGPKFWSPFMIQVDINGHPPIPIG